MCTRKRAVLARLHSTQSCLPYVINSLSLSQHLHILKQEAYIDCSTLEEFVCAHVAGLEG